MSSSDSMSGSTMETAPLAVEDGVAQEPEKKTEGERKNHKHKRVMAFDASFAARFMKAESILNTDKGLSLAQCIIGTRSTNVPFLLSKLSQKATRKKLESLNSSLSQLDGADSLTVGVTLSTLFCEEKDMPNIVYLVLNLVAPERGFAKPSGDNRKDAVSMASKWGDGVDLSILSDLII